jgi:hypothetical protein
MDFQFVWQRECSHCGTTNHDRAQWRWAKEGRIMLN